MVFPASFLQMMKEYRGVLLDADNTLFDYDRAEAEALDETFAGTIPDVPRGEAAETYRRSTPGTGSFSSRGR